MIEIANVLVAVSQVVSGLAGIGLLLWGIGTYIAYLPPSGKRPSKIHDPEGYESHYKGSDPERAGLGCVMIIAGIVLSIACASLDGCYQEREPKTIWESWFGQVTAETHHRL